MRDRSNFFDSRASRPNGEALRADPADRWLDDALRTVPLPAGFLARVGLLAGATAAKSSDRGDGRLGPTFVPNDWPRA
ncbi:MAG TPA: hypothetical protein VGM76_07095 [Lacipirellulaceae bacterium]